MASIRIITVHTKKYIQVVEYFIESGQRRLRVLKAFGEDSLVNRLKAKQFESSYNLLKAFRSDVTPQDADETTAIFNTALILFGAVLGAKLIADLFKDKNS